MTVVVFNDPSGNFDESTIKEEKFNTRDPEQAKTASMAMAMTSRRRPAPPSSTTSPARSPSSRT